MWVFSFAPHALFGCLVIFHGGPLLAAAKSLQSCPTVQPPRRQPTRLPHPWDSPGKKRMKEGNACHFLLQCTKVKSESEVAQSCLTLSNPMDCSLPGSSVCGIFQARVLEWGAIAFSTLNHYMHCFSFLAYGDHKLFTNAPSASYVHTL